MSAPGTQTQPSFRISRSPLVWLGMFGFAFILWSWANSMHRMAGIGRLVEIREVHPPKYPTPPTVFRHTEFYGHQGGCLTASMAIRNFDGLRVDVVGYQLHNSIYVLKNPTWFPMPGITKNEVRQLPSKASYISTHLRLPYWVVLSFYLLAWTGAMASSRRRVRKIMLQSQASAP